VEQAVRDGVPGAEAIRGYIDQVGDQIQAGADFVNDTLQKVAEGRISVEEGNRRQREQEQVLLRAIEAEKDRIRSQQEAIRSTISFGQTLEQVASELASSVLQDARSRADQTRREANAANARQQLGDLFGLGGGEQRQFDARVAGSASQRAQRDLAAAQERQRRFGQQRTAAVEAFSVDAAAGRLGDELQRIVRDLAAARTAGDTRRVSELERRRDAAFEATPAARQLAQQANVIDVANQVNVALEEEIRRFAESVGRGRELLISPRQQESQQIQQQLDDATNAALQSLLRPLEGGIFPQRAQAEIEALRRVIEDDFITVDELADLFQQFPEIQREFRGQVEAALAQLEGVKANIDQNGIAGQLADNRANALLQGPSRAALTAADVTTTQGQSELNRLLRGDDPARDVNLEEMQKQTNKLDEVVVGITKLREKLGVAD
jgi:hypothetical protein